MGHKYHVKLKRSVQTFKFLADFSFSFNVPDEL